MWNSLYSLLLSRFFFPLVPAGEREWKLFSNDIIIIIIIIFSKAFVDLSFLFFFFSTIMWRDYVTIWVLITVRKLGFFHLFLFFSSPFKDVNFIDVNFIRTERIPWNSFSLEFRVVANRFTDGVVKSRVYSSNATVTVLKLNDATAGKTRWGRGGEWNSGKGKKRKSEFWWTAPGNIKKNIVKVARNARCIF